MTIDQFDARLDRAAAAKTPGEPEQVMADLPAGDPGQLPERFEPRMITATPKGTPRRGISAFRLTAARGTTAVMQLAVRALPR